VNRRANGKREDEGRIQTGGEAAERGEGACREVGTDGEEGSRKRYRVQRRILKQLSVGEERGRVKEEESRWERKDQLEIKSPSRILNARKRRKSVKLAEMEKKPPGQVCLLEKKRTKKAAWRRCRKADRHTTNGCDGKERETLDATNFGRATGGARGSRCKRN